MYSRLCCSVLQFVAVCFSLPSLQHTATNCNTLMYRYTEYESRANTLLKCVELRYIVLCCVALWCALVHWCSLQCTVVHCVTQNMNLEQTQAHAHAHTHTLIHTYANTQGNLTAPMTSSPPKWMVENICNLKHSCT